MSKKLVMKLTMLKNCFNPAGALLQKLEAIFEGRDSKEIFLRADRETPYGLVAKALAAAREAGARQLGMVTEPES